VTGISIELEVRTYRRNAQALANKLKQSNWTPSPNWVNQALLELNSDPDQERSEWTLENGPVLESPEPDWPVHQGKVGSHIPRLPRVT